MVIALIVFVQLDFIFAVVTSGLIYLCFWECTSYQVKLKSILQLM